MNPGAAMTSFTPAYIFLIGALILPLIPKRFRSLFFLIIPVITFVFILNLQVDTSFQMTFINFQLNPLRVDRLSLAFSYVFCLISFFGGIYAYHLKSTGEQIAALLYAGSALGAIFAGDLLTLFVYWEIMLVGSASLIWFGGQASSGKAGMRYIIVHLIGGSFLLAGILLHYTQTGSIHFGPLEGSGSHLILIGFAINAAIPPLHAWLTDAYPEASVTGTVFLSAFTTKVAAYALIRGFEGLEILMWAGAIMALYGAIFAIMENDIRRILSYSTISQVGFIVSAVGIGGQLAINAAVAQAFSHILYKGLLFMGAGAVIYATGKRNLSDTGGLFKKLPAVFVLYMIGAFAISGFPLFSGFVSKGMVTHAAEVANFAPVLIMLLIASSGTFLHTGLRLPYFIWFGEGKNLNVNHVPKGMYIGMGLTALACIVIGVYPNVLYNILPYSVDYQPYTISHLWETAGILVFTALVFWIMIDKIKPKPGITLDFDWFYRRPASLVYQIFVVFPSDLFGAVENITNKLVSKVAKFSANPIGSCIQPFKNVVSKAKNEPLPPPEPMVFDEHRYRFPIGIMMLILILGFVIVASVNLLS
jgi:multicomponent Na+:H+ antiporter subunit D